MPQLFFYQDLDYFGCHKTKPNNCNTLHKRHKQQVSQYKKHNYHSLVENIHCTLQIIHLYLLAD